MADPTLTLPPLNGTVVIDEAQRRNDLANLGVRIPSTTTRRFWTMVAHYHGQTWNGAEIARTGTRDAWFWGTHSGAEIDLLIAQPGERVGIEIKRTDAPRMIPSIRNAIDDLELSRVIVAHAGSDRYPLAENVEATAAVELLIGGG